MGQDLQSECRGDRGGEEGGEKSQEGEVVLYAVCCPVSRGSLFSLRGCLVDFGLMRRVYRKPKHDKGSVEKEVEEYLKRRRLIRSGALGVKDPLKSAKNPSSSRSGVGAR